MAIRVYIDQGHNPVNPNAGAEGNGYREQDIVYVIGHELAMLLDENKNFVSRLSRPTQDTQLGVTNTTSLNARVNDAVNWGANYFISLHTNASDIRSASGIEAFAYSRESEGYVLGGRILFWLQRFTGLNNRGIFSRPGLYILRRTPMPSVLVELGFITNYYDATLMGEQPYLFAEGIFYGLLDYFGLL